MSNLETASTTAVAVKVLENKPAVVNFNYDEISLHLDSVLAKYKGLVFTESTASDCKKTITELRKGQKALDEFRKATKKQLTESVTNFEFQCKTLFNKFETVIKPLTEQQDQFELDRKEKKRVEIQAIIDALVSENGLNEKYASQLVILEEYFNKGKSIKVIKSGLAANAGSLKIQQDKEDQDTELIQTKVDLANAQYQLANKLMAESYLRLLYFKSISEIDALISADAQKMNEAEKMTSNPIQQDPPAQVPHRPMQVGMANEFAVCYQGPPAASNNPGMAQLITAVYEITGTEEQLAALEAYLDANNYTWIDRPNE